MRRVAARRVMLQIVDQRREGFRIALDGGTKRVDRAEDRVRLRRIVAERTQAGDALLRRSAAMVAHAVADDRVGEPEVPGLLGGPAYQVAEIVLPLGECPVGGRIPRIRLPSRPCHQKKGEGRTFSSAPGRKKQ